MMGVLLVYECMNEYFFLALEKIRRGGFTRRSPSSPSQSKCFVLKIAIFYLYLFQLPNTNTNTNTKCIKSHTCTHKQ